MKGLPWIIVGIGVGAAITYMLFNEPQPEYDTAYDGFTDVARKTFSWGAKKQAEGKVSSFAGAVKQGVGNLTNNPDLADEGAADRVAGKVKDAAGQLGQAVGQTIHDLNK
jgi:uncharacterized protein YjbJ (UPF0337 family)